MKHVPVTISDAAQSLPHDDASLVADAYDPVRERAVARRLRTARWRRLALVTTAVVMAAAAAGSFTMMNRDKIRAGLVAEPVATAPEAEDAPALASSTSRPVQPPGPGTDPNKAQARVIVPSEPEPPAARPPATEAAPAQMQDTQTASAPRAVPLSPPPPRGDGTAADDPAALPAAALGFAPVPAPRPSRAP